MNAATRATNPIRSRRLSPDLAASRDRTDEAAQRLTLLATRNWERALAGALAVPAAAALTTAAAALFAASVLERTFELLDLTLGSAPFRADADRDVAPEGRPSDAANAANVGSDRPRASGQPGDARARSERGVSPGAKPASAARVSLRSGVTPASGAPASAKSGATRASAESGTLPESAASVSTPVRESERVAAKSADSWDVVLIEAGANPIALIRELRELTGRELRDLKLLVDSAPEIVTGTLPRVDADSLRERIQAAGGRVEVRRA